MVQCQRELAQQNSITLVYCNIVQSLPPPSLPILSESIHWGRDGGLVTAYSSPGVSQQTQYTYPREATGLTYSQPRRLTSRSSCFTRGVQEDSGFWGDKRRFMEMMVFPLFYSRDDQRKRRLSWVTNTQTQMMLHQVGQCRKWAHTFMQCVSRRESMYFYISHYIRYIFFYIFLRTEMEEMLLRISHGSLAWIWSLYSGVFVSWNWVEQSDNEPYERAG